MSKKTTSKSDQDLSFEEALAQVDEIVSRIESGEAGLEKSIAEYERGMELLRKCKDVLTRAEQRVQELNRKNESDSGDTPTDGNEEE